MRRRVEAPLYERAARLPLLWVLRRLTWLVVRRHRPFVVAITGSVGKTTTKDLIAEVLERRHRIWATAATANTELGLALTVGGAQVVRRQWRDWTGAFVRCAALAVAPRGRYPEILVVEMATGRPGELRRITRAVQPDVAVVLNVRRTHWEQFGSLDAIAAEKAWLVRRLRPGGTAVLNADDERVAAMAALAPGRVVRFGEAPEADVLAERLESGPGGTVAGVRIGDRELRVESPLVGRRRASALLAALAVADLLGVPDEDALAVMRRFSGPPGRLRAVAGREGLTILDDAYSASPDAVEHALEVLRECEGPRRALLGEIPQLASEHVRVHRAIGAQAAGWLDELVAVGGGGRHIAAGAVGAGMDAAAVRWAPDGPAAAALLDGARGGTLLVTGAHTLGLEKAVRGLLADPDDPAVLDRSAPAEPTRRPPPPAASGLARRRSSR